MPPPECPTWPRPPPRACCNFFRGSSLSSMFNFQVPARFLVRGASGAFAAEALCESCEAVPGNGPGGACAFVATVDDNAATRKAAPRVSRKMFVCKLATDCPSSEFPETSTKVPSRWLCLHSYVKRLSTKKGTWPESESASDGEDGAIPSCRQRSSRRRPPARGR